MRKNKRKKEAPPLSVPSGVITEKGELCKAIGYIRAACENLSNLYLLAKERGDGEEEMYYYSRFLVLDQNLWSLVNH